MPPAEPSPTPQPAPWRSTQFQLVDGVNRYRAGQQEVDGTIMLYGAVGGHMCSFAQLTDYSRGLEVGRRKGPRESASPAARLPGHGPGFTAAC